MIDEENGLGVRNYHAVFATAPLDKPGSEYRKARGSGMYDFFVGEINGGVRPDPSASFYCGDAAGRAGDPDDDDVHFADAIGLPFRTPEEVLGPVEGEKPPPTEGVDTGIFRGEPSTSPNSPLVEALKVRRRGRVESREGEKRVGVGKGLRRRKGGRFEMA